jgi:effector-binding domain-containing protein
MNEVEFLKNYFIFETIKKVKTNNIYTMEKVNIEKVESRNLLSIRKQFLWKDAGQEMGEMYGNILKYIGENKLKTVGTPISLAHSWDDIGGDCECGIFIDKEFAGNEQITTSTSYSGKVAVIVHKGAYHNTSDSWSELYKHIEENKLKNNGVPWEEYVTDPHIEKDENKYITKLIQPIV